MTDLLAGRGAEALGSKNKDRLCGLDPQAIPFETRDQATQVAFVIKAEAFTPTVWDLQNGTSHP